MKPLRILLADDHAVVRIGLASLLEAERDMVVVGQAKNGEEAVEIARTEKPDIVVMDLMMPRMNGADATAALSAECPAAKVIVLTSYGAADDVAHALEAGAAGALMKTAEDGALVDAIRRIVNGERVISPEIRQLLAEDPPVPDLTPRQREILSSITRGLTNREIAVQLGIRRDGVDRHVNAILTKVGAANRAEAVAIALRKHLLQA